MPTPSALQNRLNDIGHSLSKRSDALALFGLGSAGPELDRMDEFSDLDFFAIVAPGSKHHYIHNLDWLTDIHPVSYAFLNSPDGYKLLFSDGIFCEFAVFEEHELAGIPFSEGRMIWKRDWISDEIRKPVRKQQPPHPSPTDWLIGEAVTNLYVGLCRFRRGEKLSAMRFIQWYAVDRLLDLAERIETPNQVYSDSFSPDRRFEQRFPELSEKLGSFCQGYDRSPESALAYLEFLEQHFEVNQAMAAEVRKLAEENG